MTTVAKHGQLTSILLSWFVRGFFIKLWWWKDLNDKYVIRLDLDNRRRELFTHLYLMTACILVVATRYMFE
jgi:hypothetical protein